MMASRVETRSLQEEESEQRINMFDFDSEDDSTYYNLRLEDSDESADTDDIEVDEWDEDFYLTNGVLQEALVIKDHMLLDQLWEMEKKVERCRRNVEDKECTSTSSVCVTDMNGGRCKSYTLAQIRQRLEELDKEARELVTRSFELNRKKQTGRLSFTVRHIGQEAYNSCKSRFDPNKRMTRNDAAFKEMMAKLRAQGVEENAGMRLCTLAYNREKRKARSARR